MLTTTVLLILSIFGIAVVAFSPGDVVASSPTDPAYTNDTNFTAGFIFSWTDNDDDSYNTSECKLYIQNDSYDGIFTGANEYAIQKVALESTNYTMYMNSSFRPKNNTVYYWRIRCENTSAIYTSQSTHPAELYLDLTKPTITDQSRSLSNGSWSNGAYRQELIIADSLAAAGRSFQCKIINSSGSVLATEDAVNATPVNVTATPLDGNHSLLGACYDSVGTQAVTGVLSIYQDATVPTGNWGTGTPTEGSVVDKAPSTLYINFTFIEVNPLLITIDLNGTNTTVTHANCTTINGTTSERYCQYIYNDQANGVDLYATAYITDNAGNELVIGPRTFTVDNATVTISPAGRNLTITSSIATYNVSISGISPASCSVKMYDRGGTNYKTLTGNLGALTAGNTYDCSGTIDVDDMNAEGPFYMTYTVTSDAGNVSFGGNQTGVYKALKTGWNLMTWTDVNITVSDACEQVDGCSQVSLFNNTGKRFQTYSTSTPSVNNGSNFTAGDAILMYVSEDTEAIMNENLPDYNGPGTNISVSTVGWNTFGLVNNGSINSTLYATAYSGQQNITWVSYFNASSEKFYTCPRAYLMCTSTTRNARAIQTNLGDALWVLTDANVTINRSYLED